jgi:hypothetical protein
LIDVQVQPTLAHGIGFIRFLDFVEAGIRMVLFADNIGNPYSCNKWLQALGVEGKERFDS